MPSGAVACVRCGSAVARSSGLSRSAMSAMQKNALAQAFGRSRIFPSPSDPGTPLAGVAWTGYGGSAALLVQNESILALERLTLTASADSVLPWSERTTLIDRLPAGLLEALVAPPLACRAGAALVTTQQFLFFPNPESRMRSLQQQPIRWNPKGKDQLIRGAAQSQSADAYFAVAADGEGVSVRDQTGAEVARFDQICAGNGLGVGLAVKGRQGDMTIYVWSNGRIGWRRVAGGGTAGVEAILEMPALRTPPITWRERFFEPHSDPISWNGWLEAAAGVFPMMLGDVSRPKFGALIVANDAPSVVFYYDGCPRFVASGALSTILFGDGIGLKAVHPRSGAQLAVRSEAMPISTVFLGLSSGSFLSLVDRSVDDVTLIGWNLRNSEVIKAFEVQLRTPATPGGRSDMERAPLQFRAELAPLEIDDGVAIALQEGAGGMSRMRLWCEFEAFRSGVSKQ